MWAKNAHVEGVGFTLSRFDSVPVLEWIVITGSLAIVGPPQGFCILVAFVAVTTLQPRRHIL